MLTEASAIRKAISELKRPYRQSPYPKDLRKRITDYILSRRPEFSWVDISEEISVPVNTMWKWCRPLASGKDKDTGPSNKELLPVMIKPNNDSASISSDLYIRTPGGYCLAGLSKEDALVLFERLP